MAVKRIHATTARNYKMATKKQFFFRNFAPNQAWNTMCMLCMNSHKFNLFFFIAIKLPETEREKTTVVIAHHTQNNIRSEVFIIIHLQERKRNWIQLNPPKKTNRNNALIWVAFWLCGTYLIISAPPFRSLFSLCITRRKKHIYYYKICIISWASAATAEQKMIE